MILQALCDYYDRKSNLGDIAPEGFEKKEIPFVIVLDEQGNFVNIEDTREGEGKSKRAKLYLVPQCVKKTSGVNANLLWENPAYIFGLDKSGNAERARQQKQAFLSKIQDANKFKSDTGIQAVINFLNFDSYEKVYAHPSWQEISEKSPYLTFRLSNSIKLVCQSDNIKEFILNSLLQNEGEKRFCLVSGKEDYIARLHPSIKGVWGAQSSGANIISFNKDSFCSYGKLGKQGENAPVGHSSAFRYTTALNHLLSKDSSQRMQVGDASTVFWAEKIDPVNNIESFFADIFDEDKDNPDKHTQAVKALYQSPETGQFNLNNDNTKFYVLGLSPNASRISVRFWHVASVAELAARIRQHFEDIKIDRAAAEYPSLSKLLVSMAAQSKSDNIQPNVAGDLMMSILSGSSYPRLILQAVLNRIRAEREVTYERAALLKAFLNRQSRFLKNTMEEIKVALDEKNANVGYRLGRLFALLEKIQEEASPNLNATIKDRFYGAASSTPVTVFANLLKLKNHHIAKFENRGRAINLEKMIGQVMEEVADFPALLSQEDQGRFAIGYYHQRQKLFTKTESVGETENVN